MKHAPPGYDCPFCRIAATLDSPDQDPAVVLVDSIVFAVVPLHYYGNIRGNCLVVPREHHENLFDAPPAIGSNIQRASRKLAWAMQSALNCEGISTRQHNGPAGDQDVWHFHQHVIPRYSGDELWKGHKAAYDQKERLEIAATLRAAVKPPPVTAESWEKIHFTEGVPIPYKATFTLTQFEKLRQGLLPESMDNKWFIYFEEPYLFLHRSWTGQPVYRVFLSPDGDGRVVGEALWAAEFAKQDGANTAFEVQLLDFLISNLLLGESKPFPHPGGVNEPAPGVLQHHISGTGYPEKKATPGKPRWKFW